MAERYRTFSALPGYGELLPEELDRLPDLFDDSGNPIAPQVNPYPSLTNPQIIGSDSGILAKTEPPVPIAGDSIAATDAGTSVPTTGSPLLSQIASPPDIGTNFGFKLANYALGQIPLIGPMLQQGHLEEKQRENLTQQLQGLQASAANLPPEYQQVLADLVRQGQGKEALQEYPKLAEKVAKQRTQTADFKALQDALKFRIDRIQDPVIRDSLKALSQSDPKSALIQTGQYENALISRDFRNSSEQRAQLNQEIAAAEGSIKDIKDNPAGKRAFDIKNSFLLKQFTPKDATLPPKKFIAKFGLDPKKDVLVQTQLKGWLERRQADFPDGAPADPAQLLEGVESIFADANAINEQSRINDIKQTLQQQVDEKRNFILQKGAARSAKPAAAPKYTREQLLEEAKRRELQKKSK